LFSEVELKTKLKQFASDKGMLPSPGEMEALIQAMLAYIGAVDSELRDDLIYPTLAGWIMRGEVLSSEQCRGIFNIMQDEKHLLLGLGEKDTDTVFTRTFSALQLPPLLIRHRQTPYLDSSQVMRAKENLLRYIREENDRRGYVEGKGWAHGIAHSADALDDLVQCSELSIDDLREILATLVPVIAYIEFTYGFGEDERLVTPVIAILRRGLIPMGEMKDWLAVLVSRVTEQEAITRRVVARANVKNFLQSLFFRTRWATESPELQQAIDDLLNEMNPYKGC